jgi:hypothetical protein
VEALGIHRRPGLWQKVQEESPIRLQTWWNKKSSCLRVSVATNITTVKSGCLQVV